MRFVSLHGNYTTSNFYIIWMFFSYHVCTLDLNTGVGAYHLCVSRNMIFRGVRSQNTKSSCTFKCRYGFGLRHVNIASHSYHVNPFDEIIFLVLQSCLLLLLFSNWYLLLCDRYCVKYFKLNHQQYLPTDLPFFTFTVMLPDTEHYHRYNDYTYNRNYPGSIF